MAKTSAELALILRANINQFLTNLKKAEKEFDGLGKKMTDVGTTLSASISLPLIGVGTAAVASAAKIDSLRRGLTAVAGSAEEADAQFARLKEVAKLPGLGFEEAIQGSINLQAAGFSAETAEATLKGFGNALATVGRGKADLDGVILALGQMASKGKISAEEVNQIAERVPQIRKVMQDAFGTAVPEELQKAGISAQVFVEKVNSELLKLPQVTGGLQNSFENFGDTVKVSLGTLGDSIARSINLEGLLNDISEAIAGVTEWFQNLTPEAQKVIVVVAGIAAAIGPLLVTLGAASKLLPVIASGFAALVSPVGLAIAAIAALALAFSGMRREQSEFEKLGNRLKQLNTDAANAIAGERAELDILIKTVKDKNTTDEQRAKAMRQINEISPKFLGNLKEEDILTGKADTAVKAYTASLLQKAKAQLAQERIVEIQRKINELEDEQAKRVKVALDANAQLQVQGEETKRISAEGSVARVKQIEEELAALGLEQSKLLDLAVTLNRVNQTDTGADSFNASAKSAEFAVGSIAFFSNQVKELKDQLDNTAAGTGYFDELKTRLAQAQVDLDRAVNATKQLDVQPIAPIENTSISGSTGGLVDTSASINGFAAMAASADQAALAVQRVNDQLAMSQVFSTMMSDAIVNAAGATGEALGTLVSSVASGMGDAQEQFFNAIRDTIKALLAQAVAAQIAASIKAGALSANPILGAALAASAPAVIGGLFDALVPKFAQGGMVTGPTLAMVGDNRSGKEAIIPFEKMGQFLGQFQTGGSPVVMDVRISGQDLLLVQNRAAKLNSNTLGS
jgi:tape measure domain-containing protein